jgi:predicted  nucleic acid-binding Zn-ribbon protein
LRPVHEAGKPEALMHKHRCPRCAAVWQHGDDCIDMILAHSCPICGSGSWWKFWGAEEATHELPSCRAGDDIPALIPGAKVTPYTAAFGERRTAAMKDRLQRLQARRQRLRDKREGKRHPSCQLCFLNLFSPDTKKSD